MKINGIETHCGCSLMCMPPRGEAQSHSVVPSTTGKKKQGCTIRSPSKVLIQCKVAMEISPGGFSHNGPGDSIASFIRPSMPGNWPHLSNSTCPVCNAGLLQQKKYMLFCCPSGDTQVISLEYILTL